MFAIIKKLNLAGRNVLEYRKEYLNKDYPPIVKKSLKSSAETILVTLNSELSIYDSFINEEISQDNFKDLLLESKSFYLSKKEIEEEGKNISKELLKELTNHGAYGVNVNFDIDREKYVFSFDIEMGKGFLVEYLGLNKDNAKEHMKPTGTVPNFAKLRLKKIGTSIVKDFGAVLRESSFIAKNEKIDKFLTVVEPDFDVDRFKTTIEYLVDFEVFETDNNKEEQVLLFKRFKGLADEYIEKRMIV